MNIILRPAVKEDVDMIFKWRNAEETRRYFFDSHVLEAKEHLPWFINALDSNNRVMLIAEKDVESVGLLRLDLVGIEAEIDIYLKPGLSGKGIGASILEQGIIWARIHLPNIKCLTAKVLPENVASCHLFKKVGFDLSYMGYKYFL